MLIAKRIRSIKMYWILTLTSWNMLFPYGSSQCLHIQDVVLILMMPRFCSFKNLTSFRILLVPHVIRDLWEVLCYQISWLRKTICDDPWEKGMFQDVDVKIQVRSYLNFDVDVSKHAFFLWTITITSRKR